MRQNRVLIYLIIFLGILIGSTGTAMGADQADAKVDIDFRDAEIRHIFQVLADLDGLGFVADSSVQGETSLTLSGLSVREAIELVAQVTGYQYRIIGNTLAVSSRESRVSEGDVQTSDVAVIRLEYIGGEEAAQVLSLILPSENIVFAKSTQTLVIRGTDSQIQRARKLLTELDQAPAQSSQPNPTIKEDILEVLGRLASSGGFNFVADSSLSGRQVVASFPNSDPRKSIDLLAQATDLKVRWDGDTVVVVPEVESTVSLTKLYWLDYAEVNQVTDALALAVPQLKMQADEKAKSIVLQGNRDLLEQADALITQLDKPPMQVLVEARVEEVSRDALKQIGMDWDLGVTGNLAFPSFNSLKWEADELQFIFEALEKEGRSYLLASPQIATLSGQTASIFIGDRIPILVTSTTDEGEVQKIQDIDVGITLEITPNIGQDGLITTKITPEVATITEFTDQGLPHIRTREAQTTVRVRDGQPIVIGGLIRQEDRESISKVPFLSDFPLLGRLFGSNDEDRNQSEMIIIVTPHLLRDENDSEVPRATVDSGSYPDVKQMILPSSNQALSPSNRLSAGISDLWAGGFSLKLEKRISKGASAVTTLFSSPFSLSESDVEGQALGLGLGFRKHWDGEWFKPWLDLGGQIVWPDKQLSDIDNSAYLNASLGTSLELPGSRFFIEPYLRWGIDLKSEGLKLAIPASGAGTSVGVDVGYEF